MLNRLLFIALLLVASPLARAKEFSNSYLRFTLPDNWKCEQVQTTWVCRGNAGAKSTDAVIVMTAKVRSGNDTLESQESTLKDPGKVGSYAKAHPEKAKIVYLKRSSIGGQEWVDSVHENSQKDGYLTRYLATVKDDRAILVSMTVKDDSLSKYEKDFMSAIESLRVAAP